MSRPVDNATAPRWADALTVRLSDPMTLDPGDLAAAAGYSPFHFSRLFAASVGVAPGAYLTGLRIHTARHALLTGDDAVIDVATAVGFSSLSSFTRRFRAVTGVTPGAMRRLAHEVAGSSLRSFAVLPAGETCVRVDVRLPEGFSPRGDAGVWLGWYERPVPFGLPKAGLFVTGRQSVSLPLCPGAPFLLAHALPAQADALDHLAPADPMVAVHPRPIVGPSDITLHVSSTPGPLPIPLLSALTSLVPR